MGNFEKEVIKIREEIRQFAYLKARRKKLEEFKKILLYRVMKEISAEEKLSVPDQKKAAQNMPEYKMLLDQIRQVHITETDHLWKIQQFFVNSEGFVLSSNLDRQANWNIHNV